MEIIRSDVCLSTGNRVRRGAETGNRPPAADEEEHVEDPGAHGLSRQRHAGRLSEGAHLDVPLRGQGVEESFEGDSRELRRLLDPVRELAEKDGR